MDDMPDVALMTRASLGVDRWIQYSRSGEGVKVALGGQATKEQVKGAMMMMYITACMAEREEVPKDEILPLMKSSLRISRDDLAMEKGEAAMYGRRLKESENAIEAFRFGPRVKFPPLALELLGLGTARSSDAERAVDHDAPLSTRYFLTDVDPEFCSGRGGTNESVVTPPNRLSHAVGELSVDMADQRQAPDTGEPNDALQDMVSDPSLETADNEDDDHAFETSKDPELLYLFILRLQREHRLRAVLEAFCGVPPGPIATRFDSLSNIEARTVCEKMEHLRDQALKLARQYGSIAPNTGHPRETSAEHPPPIVPTDGNEKQLSPSSNSLLGLREISALATWTVSTHKPHCGAAALLNPMPSTFWQSDGPQPHLLTAHFARTITILKLRVYLDFSLDESYTPTKIEFFGGVHGADYGLVQFGAWSGEEPRGWQEVALDGQGSGGRACVRARVLQVRVSENHQNGKDTHVRGIQVFAKDERIKATVAITEDENGFGGAAKVERRHYIGEEPAWMADAEIR